MRVALLFSGMSVRSASSRVPNHTVAAAAYVLQASFSRCASSRSGQRLYKAARTFARAHTTTVCWRFPVTSLPRLCAHFVICHPTHQLPACSCGIPTPSASAFVTALPQCCCYTGAHLLGSSHVMALCNATADCYSLRIMLWCAV